MEKSNSDYNKRVRELRRNVRSTLKMTPGGGGYTVVSKTNSSTLLPSATGSNECTKRRKIKETDVEGFTETDVKGITETDVEGFTETDVDRPSDNLPIVDQASNAQPPVDHPSAQRHSSQTITSELSYYLSLTRERDGVVPVGQKMLCLANYVEKTGTVDVTDYKVVIKINGSMYCSCGKAQELMLGDCRPVATWASIELCQHMNVLRRCTSLPALDNWFDTEHTYSSHSDLVSTSSVHAVNEWTAIVYDSRTNRFGCVYIHAGSIRCRCSSHRGACVFISAFKVAMKDDESLGPLQANLLSRETITISERTSVSWKPIVIATSRLNIPTSSTAMKLQCSQCDGNMFREMQTEDVRCFDVFGTITVRVTSGVCVSCKASSRCDGGDEGILNMGDYLVTHRLLRDYLKLFTSDGLPLHSFHKKLYWSYLEHGFAAGTCLSYHLLRMAWGAFSKLLILNNFSCPKCKVNPPVIVCDGLTLSYRKRHRYTTDNPSSTSTSPLHGCKYSDLLILRDTSFRNQLLRVMSDDNIQQDDISQLLSDARTKAVFMVDILSQFLTWQDVPKYWSHLLKDIAKSSPINGFAQTSADNFLKVYDIISGSSSKLYDCDLKTIAQICPPIFYFVKSSTATDRHLLVPIMSEILKVLQYVEASPGHLFAESLGIEDTAGMFPELPVIRERGAYAMDSSQATGSCRKLAKGHKNLLPGIFLLHCEHGVCYGFHVMDSHESPNVPFTIIQTRFQQAPKVIIYDNACHLHSYALNRNPAYFRGTKFLVDRFHWNNHTACSSGYCVDGYPQLRSLNTQLAEQRNSTLVRLKASLSYQHQDNFFHSMKVFLSFRNTLKVLMIRNPENDAENTLAQLLGLFK